MILIAAFTGCINLRDVLFEEGSSLKLIGPRAFQNCYSLEKINIPPSVHTIQEKAFEGYRSLQEIVYCGSHKLDVYYSTYPYVGYNFTRIFVLEGVYPINRFGIHEVIFTSHCLYDLSLKGKIHSEISCFSHDIYIFNQLALLLLFFLKQL